MPAWVMVVDDDTAILQLLGRILSHNNMRVTALRSGRMLPDYIDKNGAPDIILLDIKMLEMDGFETLRLLRQSEEEKKRPHIPVIFLTGDEDAEAESRAYEAGASDFILKPFVPDDLIRRICNVLEKQERVTLPEAGAPEHEDINTISEVLGERSIPNHALLLDKESFANVYRYVMRYIIRNHKTACKVMFSLFPGKEAREGEYDMLCDEFGDHIRDSLRKSDVFMRNRPNCYFVFLTDIRRDAIEKVIGNILSAWDDKHPGRLHIEYENEFVRNTDTTEHVDVVHRVAVVDDDAANRKVAARILSGDGYDVNTFTSGAQLLENVETCRPGLILLDIMMPEMDGFETMKRLKNMGREIADIPVIFLTADENDDSERNGLSLGAVDFIKKPFVPEVLLLRVRHLLELFTLQKSLGEEVERKTQENKLLLMHVVEALAGAIDAKDTYTNGHSNRVAEYSREIARRAGYSTSQQDEIYMMGLLHDVGKIGVPDAVINKPGRLIDEEYEIIKTHPVKGAKILSSIEEQQRLAIGARWHHERYDGKGYPDGLAGNAIPEEARILSVADAYDAMTSRRSYRGVLSQEHVRGEIINGRGTQFDPEFANIMLEMMAEDKNYDLREK